MHQNSIHLFQLEPTILAITTEKYYPLQSFPEATFAIESKMGLNDTYFVCAYGVICPAKAGIRQTLSVKLDGSRLTRGESKQVKFKITHFENHNEEVIYCVEFPAKAV